MFDKYFFDDLLVEASVNERLRCNYDLRNSSEDDSQRMFNALMPGTEIPIHRHKNSSETVVCIRGKIVEVFYEESVVYDKDINGDVLRRCDLQEVDRFEIDPLNGIYGIQVPKGVWHTVEVLEPSVIIEVKDGQYGYDGSEEYNKSEFKGQAKFSNSFGDLKKNIEYLIGEERLNGSIATISPLYVAMKLNAPLLEVEAVMKEMGIY